MKDDSRPNDGGRGEDALSELLRHVEAELPRSRYAGGHYERGEQGQRLVVFVKELSRSDRERLREQLGERFDLLRLEGARYSYDELRAVQAQVRDLMTNHPGGTSISGSSIRPAANQVQVVMDDSSPALEAVLAATTPPGSVAVERGRLIFVLEADRR